MKGKNSMKLPDLFVANMYKLLGAEFDSYIESYEKPRWYGLRVNTNKISVEDFLEISPFELQPIPWIENGFYYDGDTVKPAKHPYYAAGYYYLQEPSAMTPANRLPISEGDRVLDLCAAPGGKTTELGAKLAGSGILVSNDISNSRARTLLKNMEIAGIENAYVLSEDPKKLVPIFMEFFDKILLDVPCSGEGMFRKDNKMIQSWLEQGPLEYAVIQKNLILQGADMLKPGGYMLYSTCTFSKNENEEVISYLLQEREGFELCDILDYGGFCQGYDGLEKAVRIWPHRMNGEGHFLALLHKKEERYSGRESKKMKAQKIPNEFKDFMQHVGREFRPARIKISKERINYLPEVMIDVKGIRTLREGLLLGELKKNRFEPSQAFAMSLKKREFDFTIDFSSDDIRVIKYLKGETLDVEDMVGSKEKGWCLVCVEEAPLGFGKVANQTLKNKYALGWRWQSE